eukprot:TRINITY_DN1960_c3_g1_i1.p1 TRINITY_DN1960_c3_g1~~TRINITY_DN1960_c3_g1_i1.p1  ORF type:complete len:208 (+),score=25.04 TRINITY_DN1960_c3_g1_i1:76-699(+)
MVPAYCKSDDADLARWTVLRYLIVGAIVAYRVCLKMDRNDHASSLPKRFIKAGCDFANSEGIGLLIYFFASAVMDNIFIFFHSSGEYGSYCGYVKMVALYSMAMVTFLPTCFFAYRFQSKLYDHGSAGSKVLFVIATVLISMIFFEVRLLMVYKLGYANWIKKLLLSQSLTNYKVAIAIMVPPVVDALQSGLLILSSQVYPDDFKEI